MNPKRSVLSALMCLCTAAAAGEPSNPPDGPSPPEHRQDAGPGAAIYPTTLSSADLESRRIISLDGLAATIPAMTLTPSINSSNTPVLYMRGTGLDNPSQITRDGAVGVYEDGFYVARPEALTFDLLDLDRVDVLRGPQGALYGRNT